MEPEPKVNVLLVDDQLSNLLALEAVLAGAGLNLVRACSGEEALIRVLDDDFAVILMDVQMPKMDGFEAAALIRERDRSKHTPIIFLTAFQSTERQVFQGYTLGAVDFLSKPIVPAVLRSKVAVFVELFQKTEQVRLQAAQLHETQRREHERELTEQKRRWELERLREEAAREKKVAEEQAQRAEELARNVAERVRVEEQLRRRAAQQAAVAELGQRALAGTELPTLLDEAVNLAVRNLEVEFGAIMELGPDGEALVIRAGVGWTEGVVGHVTSGAGNASLSGFTLISNEPVVVEDLRAESRFGISAPLRDHGIISGMSVVVYGRDRPFGTLGVFGARPRTFTQDDAHFLQALANVLAAAIQRRRDEEELALVRDELAVQLADMTRLHALNMRLSTRLELAEVLQEVLAAVTGFQGTDAGVIVLRDREREEMFTAASIGFTAEQLADAEKPAPDAEAEEAMTAVISGGIVVEDATLDPVLASHFAVARRAGYHAVCTTPLLTSDGEMVGSIATYFPRLHRPSSRETRMVELYAHHAAQFIENARLYRERREADRRKDEFLAMLAHELRNPMAPILNALHLLREEGGDPAAEQAREVAERQIRHLARLVDDLLDVSRISSGKIHLRKGRVELGETVARAVETARPLFAARRHVLSVSLPDEPIPLEADATRLEQVLANLLNNAAKYTEPGGWVVIEALREGEAAVVRVRDNGIGITPELLPRIFDLFTQADRSLDRSQGGLGLGLTLVRSLVEMHGGSVTAASAGVGKGSEFVVRLPLGAPEAHGEMKGTGHPGPPPESVEARSRRVLVVEDNIDGARLMAQLLESGGHQTWMTHDGLSALEAAREQRPEVVLLDIGLPGMDGYQVAERLRRMEGMERALLVAITGYGQDVDRQRTHEAGIDLHKIKPVDPEALLKLVASDRSLVSQRSHTDQS
jgi:signal transduction histidine kinase/response regulator RpfG family c-di-GMP phosphodiesterase